jgi:hypothetical protein
MTSFSKYRPFFVMGSVYLLLMQVALLGMVFATGSIGQADFRMFYAGGTLVRTGHGDQLYDYEKTAATESEVAGKTGASLPFNHPAYEGLLFALLSFLSYKKAFWVFFCLNIALLFMIFRLLTPAAAWIRETWAALPAMVVAGFLPVGVCLFHGQDSILFLFIIVVACALLNNKSDFAAGLVLGLGMFRFQLVLPLLVFLCFARKWRLLSGFAVTCLGAVFLSILVAGSDSLLGYPRYLLLMSGGVHTESQRITYGIWPTGMPNLRGLIDLCCSRWLSSSAVQIVTIVASVILMGWAIIKRLPFEMLVMVAFLVSYHGYKHDAVLLLLPLLKYTIPALVSGWKRLICWCLLVASPTVLFAFRVPLAVMALLCLAFIAAAKAGEGGADETAREEASVQNYRSAKPGSGDEPNVLVARNED